jgi:macrolide-specific efflux system membrane fusion protein
MGWLLPTVLVVTLLAGSGAAVVLLRYPALVPQRAPTTVPVVRADVVAQIFTSGEVRAATEAGASFAVSGTVATVSVGPGTTVRAGDTLATLDDSGARGRVAAATATLDADNRALDAALSAAPIGAPVGVPAADPLAVVRLQAAIAADRAALTDAQRALDGTVLRAPRDGTVTAVAGIVGDQVVAGMPTPDDAPSRRPFVAIADLAALVIRVAVPPREIPRVTTSQPADALVNGAGTFRGDVTAVDPVPGADGTYGVNITPTVLPPALRVGQSASASITVERASSVLVVPPAAVRVTGPDRGLVVVRRPEGDRTIAVITGLSDGASVEIRKGLNTGDLVVLPRSADRETAP